MEYLKRLATILGTIIANISLHVTDVIFKRALLVDSESEDSDNQKGAPKIRRSRTFK